MGLETPVGVIGKPELFLLSCFFLEGAVRVARLVMGRFTTGPGEDEARLGARLSARGDDVIVVVSGPG